MCGLEEMHPATNKLGSCGQAWMQVPGLGVGKKKLGPKNSVQHLVLGRTELVATPPPESLMFTSAPSTHHFQSGLLQNQKPAVGH